MTSQPNRIPQGVLFDVDGTLVDTYRLYLEAYSRALQPYMGRLPRHEEIATQRPSSERHFLVEWLGAERGQECHAAMCAAYEQLHGTYCDGVYDGIPEMLSALRTAGVPLGLVTGKGRRAWEFTERELALGPFQVVITEDDVQRPKPDPGGLTSALTALNVEAGEALYIGDSISDIAAARAAGMLAGAALWPKTDPGEQEAFLEQIADYRPDWAFRRPADVTRLLATWC